MFFIDLLLLSAEIARGLPLFLNTQHKLTRTSLVNLLDSSRAGLDTRIPATINLFQFKTLPELNSLSLNQPAVERIRTAAESPRHILVFGEHSVSSVHRTSSLIHASRCIPHCSDAQSAAFLKAKSGRFQGSTSLSSNRMPTLWNLCCRSRL